MTLVVNPPRAGYGVPRTPEALSPELVLVDPELAASARAMLPEPRSALREVGPPAPAHDDDGPSRALRALSNAALAIDDGHGVPATGKRSWRVLVGVAAVTVLSLLLFDVRVQVGRTPASAETAAEPLAAASPLGRSPSASVPKHVPKDVVKPKARRFAWAPTPGATGYHVELFRRDVRIFAADTKEPQLAIPARWKLNGRRHELSAGEYRWFVWPVVSGLRASSATVQATVTIPR